MNKRRGRYYIKSKTRFCLFLLICLLISAGFFHSFIGRQVNGYNEASYTAVKVLDGDTLWDMAATYKDKDTDIRKAVYTIKEVNNLQGSELQAGTDIYIPTNL